MNTTKNITRVSHMSDSPTQLNLMISQYCCVDIDPSLLSVLSLSQEYSVKLGNQRNVLAVELTKEMVIMPTAPIFSIFFILKTPKVFYQISLQTLLWLI